MPAHFVTYAKKKELTKIVAKRRRSARLWFFFLKKNKLTQKEPKNENGEKEPREPMRNCEHDTHDTQVKRCEKQTQNVARKQQTSIKCRNNHYVKICNYWYPESSDEENTIIEFIAYKSDLRSRK